MITSSTIIFASLNSTINFIANKDENKDFRNHKSFLTKKSIRNTRYSKRLYMIPIFQILKNPIVKKVAFCILLDVIIRRLLIRYFCVKLIILLKIKEIKIKKFLFITDIIIDGLICQTSIMLILEILINLMIHSNQNNDRYFFTESLSKFLKDYIPANERETWFKLSILDRRSPGFNSKATEKFMMDRLGDYDHRAMSYLLAGFRNLKKEQLIHLAITSVRSCDKRLKLIENARILIESYPLLENNMSRFGHFRQALLEIDLPVFRMNEMTFISQYLRKNIRYIESLTSEKEKNSAGMMLLGETSFLINRIHKKYTNILNTPIFVNESLSNTSEIIISSITESIKKIRTK